MNPPRAVPCSVWGSFTKLGTSVRFLFPCLAVT
jgi:hypothetical protein